MEVQPQPPSSCDCGSLMLSDTRDIAACRQLVRRIAAELGFSVLGQTMLVTAASELARNTILHGGGGSLTWQLVSAGAKRGVRLSFEDQGPGISDIHRAMTNGWSSGKGLGLGLPGARRLVNEFDITSAPGLGTRVVITRWR